MFINIRDRMKDLGISRYELGKRIGVTYPTITSIYNGASTSIKFDILEKLCQELKCTPNDILVFGDLPKDFISSETPIQILQITKIDEVSGEKQYYSVPFSMDKRSKIHLMTLEPDIKNIVESLIQNGLEYKSDNLEIKPLNQNEFLINKDDE